RAPRAARGQRHARHLIGDDPRGQRGGRSAGIEVLVVRERGAFESRSWRVSEGGGDEPWGQRSDRGCSSCARAGLESRVAGGRGGWGRGAVGPTRRSGGLVGGEGGAGEARRGGAGSRGRGSDRGCSCARRGWRVAVVEG